MSIANDFAGDILAAFEDLAAPAVLRPASGGSVATFAMVEGGSLEAGPRSRSEYAVLRVPMAAIPDPAVGDVLEVDGVAWEYRVDQDRKVSRERAWPFWLLRCRRADSVAPAGGRP